MKYLIGLLLVCGLLVNACQSTKPASSQPLDHVFAWCIVPFDSVKRTPAERIDMLKRLGLRKYAYDWRMEHLPTMAQELALAKENDIEVTSVWVWIDARQDTVGALSEGNEQLFEIIEKAGYKGQIWVGFHANYFAGLADAVAVEKGAGIIGYLSQKAQAIGCKVGLYNHGDWFGAPTNQIKIIQALPDEELGIIFNFHHAHPQIEAFPEMVPAMMPYLWAVNLNGMRKGGPKILPIGEGDHEAAMLKLLLDQGYAGDLGVLGHVEEADVEDILKANLKGLKKILP